MEAEIINELVARALNDNLDVGDYIVKYIYLEKTIKRRLAEENRDLDHNKKIWEQCQRQYHARLEQIQNDCPHLEYDWFGDPAGGNDSHHECRWCKKQW